LLLMTMLVALGASQVRPWHLWGAIASAGLATFCLLQGMILWPIGLLCLMWRLKTARRRLQYGCAWVASGVAVVLLYFRGYDFQTDKGVSVALHHPDRAVQYFLAAIGNTYPANGGHLAIPEAIGAVILLAAVWVAVRTFRRPDRRRLPLPLALISFGLCFDISIAVGRLYLGIPEALSSRYAMPNLLIVVGVSIHFLSRRAARHSRELQHGLALSTFLVVVAVLAQIAVADHYGWLNGNSQRLVRHGTAWVEANLTRLPPREQYALFGQYAYPTLNSAKLLVAVAKADHLSVYFPPEYRFYQRLPGP
ncbi:MAG: hypothetical protein ACRDTS_19095, partial [Mycobacterium sp.]